MLTRASWLSGNNTPSTYTIVTSEAEDERIQNVFARCPHQLCTRLSDRDRDFPSRCPLAMIGLIHLLPLALLAARQGETQQDLSGASVLVA